MNKLVGQNGDYMTAFGRMKVESATQRIEFHLIGGALVLKCFYY